MIPSIEQFGIQEQLMGLTVSLISIILEYVYSLFSLLRSKTMTACLIPRASETVGTINSKHNVAKATMGY